MDREWAILSLKGYTYESYGDGTLLLEGSYWTGRCLERAANMLNQRLGQLYSAMFQLGFFGRLLRDYDVAGRWDAPSSLLAKAHSYLLSISEEIPQNVFADILSALKCLERLDRGAFEYASALAMRAAYLQGCRSADDVERRLARDDKFTFQFGEELEHVSDAEFLKLADAVGEWTDSCLDFTRALTYAFPDESPHHAWYECGYALGEFAAPVTQDKVEQHRLRCFQNSIPRLPKAYLDANPWLVTLSNFDFDEEGLVGLADTMSLDDWPKGFFEGLVYLRLVQYLAADLLEGPLYFDWEATRGTIEERGEEGGQQIDPEENDVGGSPLGESPLSGTLNLNESSKAAKEPKVEWDGPNQQFLFDGKPGDEFPNEVITQTGWARDMVERNALIYRLCMQNMAYGEIRAKLKKLKCGWELRSEQGVQRAAKEFATRLHLPAIPDRQPGRRKKNPS